MRFTRCIPAIMLALALTLGGSGYAPMQSMAQAAMSDDGGAVAPDRTMPDCPMCGPEDTVVPMCSAACPASAAILPLVAMVPVVPLAPREISSPAYRLADAATGPEPPPPKLKLLA